MSYMAMIGYLNIISDLYIAFEKSISNRYVISDPDLVADYRSSDMY